MAMKKITTVDVATSTPSSGANIYMEDSGAFKRVPLEKAADALGVTELTNTIAEHEEAISVRLYVDSDGYICLKED